MADEKDQDPAVESGSESVDPTPEESVSEESTDEPEGVEPEFDAEPVDGESVAGEAELGEELEPIDLSDRESEFTEPELAEPELAEPELAEPELGDESALEADGELVAAGATNKRSGSAVTEKKGRATPKRDSAPAPDKRTGPITFVQESVGELRKVVYPTGPQVLNYWVVVLVFVLFIIAYVGLLDLGFGQLLFKIFAG